MRKYGLMAWFAWMGCVGVQAENPWIPLFDGTSTKGWTPREEGVRLEAKNGELQLYSKKNVWVVSDLQLADFIVEMEVMLPPENERQGTNSGLGFRLTGDKGKPKGYQLEIDLAKPGGVYGIGLGGWLYPQKEQAGEFAKTSLAAFKADEWNLVKVHCEGPHIRTYVNGELMADLKDSQNLKGMFGIQHHGKGGTMRFRNLRAKDLSK